MITCLRRLGIVVSESAVVELAFHTKLRPVSSEHDFARMCRRGDQPKNGSERVVCNFSEHKERVGAKDVSMQVSGNVLQLALEDWKVELVSVVRNQTDWLLMSVQETLN